MKKGSKVINRHVVSVDWNFIFDDYMAKCKSKGCSNATFRAYRENFRLFLKYFPYSPANTNKLAFDNYIAFTIGRYPQNSTSASTHIRNIKPIMVSAMENGWLERFKIKVPPRPHKMLNYFTGDEIKNLVKPQPTRKDKFETWRCWAMSCLASQTGVRRTTMLEMRIEDINFRECVILARHTKNGDKLEFPIDDILASCLKCYIRAFRLDINKSGYLFPNTVGDRLSEARASRTFKEYCLSRNVTPRGFHAFRRAVATHAFLNGASVAMVQRQLGHKTPTMSLYYAQITQNDLKPLLETNLLKQAMETKHKLKYAGGKNK